MNAWRWAGGAVVLAAVAAAFFVSTRPAAVATVAVSEGPLVQTLVFSGRVAAPVRVELGATVTGRVLEVAVREGDDAKAGDLLARLESAELQAQASQAQVALRIAEARLAGQREVGVPTADAALEQAVATLEAAQREARRSRELFGRGYVSQARIDETERAVRIAQAQLESARAAQRANAGGGTERAQARLRVDEARAALELAQARLAQTRIVAPADGRVVVRTVDPGQIVQPGRALFVFAPRGATQLVGQADEKFLSQLATGQPARVVADAFPQRPFDARVARIAPGVDAQRGTVEVKFDVPEPPPFLREDMTLSMQVSTGRRERALTLPASAVLGAGTEARVRRLADGRVVERPVRTGLRTLERVEIVDGLAAGDAVLADPFVAEPGVRARAARDGEAVAATRAGGASAQGGTATRRRRRRGRRRGDARRGPRRALTARRTMGFAWRVAVRFLLEGRMQTLLLVVGVAAGVAVVTYITALIDGLQANTIRRTLGVQPHLTIRPVKDVPLAGRLAVPGADPSAAAPEVSSREQPRAQRTRSIDNWTPLARELERTPGIVAVSPMAGGTAIALRGEGSRAVAIVGIELERYDRIAALSDKLVEGAPRLGPGEAIVGRELADDLGVRLGDRFSLSLGRDTVESVRAVAIFDVGVRDVNRRNVYVPLRTAQSLLGIPGGATQLDLTVTEVFEAEDVARRLRARLPYEIESWMQTNSQLLSALDAQTMSTRLIRGVVMIVVVLGIASVLVVSVVQKRKEIGILRAMGASRGQMTRVFLMQGALVSAAGSVLGAALAWAMVVAFTALVKGADGQPLFPIVLRLDTFAWVALGATAAGVLAAVAPARRAAALDPAQAIRL